jgi:hypothetical protein
MMKMNKWTMALAAAGVVSLSSVAQAQEAVAGADGGSAGTLSGYISTSYGMIKDGVAPQGYWNTGADRATDKYALDVVDLRWHKDQAAQPWGAGYTFEIWAGPDADNIGSGTNAAQGSVEIMEANIDLDVGSVDGLNLKVGYFTTIVGAETYNYNANAFHSRSFGFAVEPTHHTGILGSYTVSESLEIQFGVANDSTTAVINSGDDNDPLTVTDSDSTLFMGSLKYTLPELPILGGASLYYAVINGAGADTNEQDNHYVSLENLALGVEGLTYKLAIDWTDKDVGADSTIIGHYLSYAINDKVTLNARIEMGNVNQGTGESLAFGANQNLDGLESYTIGLDYKLWENVTSRIEWRVDDADNLTSDQETLGVNIIYSF